MAELSDLEERILSELGEFVAENFAALTNSVLKAAGKDEEIDRVKAAFEALVQADLAVVGVAREGPASIEEFSKKDSLVLLGEIADSLRFDEGEGIWRWTGGEPRPQLVANESGLKEAEKILEKRGGERWWERENSDPDE